MIKKILIILFTVTLIGFISAEDLTTDLQSSGKALNLDIDAAIQQALNKNLTLKNSKIDLNNKLLSLSTSWNQFVPSLGLSASLEQRKTYSEALKNVPEDLTQHNSLSAGFSLSLNLAAQMGFNVYQTVLDWQSGKISLEQARKTLMANIQKNYYYLVILKEQINLKEKQVENTKARYEAALIKLKQGMIAEVEVLKNEYAYKSLLPDLDQSQNDYLTSLMSFKQVIGIPNDKEINLSSPIPEIGVLNYDKLSSLSVDKNLDIQGLIQQVKTAENNRNILIAELTPSVGISYSLNSRFNKDPLKDSWLSKEDWTGEGSFGFSLKIPVDNYVPFSSIQSGIIKSQNEINKSRNNLQDAIEKKKIDLVTAMMKLKQIESSVSSLQVNVDIADKTYELEQKSFMLGNQNYLDLKDAENNLFDARLKLLNAKYNYFTGTLDLKTILNIDTLN